MLDATSFDFVVKYHLFLFTIVKHICAIKELGRQEEGCKCILCVRRAFLAPLVHGCVKLEE